MTRSRLGKVPRDVKDSRLIPHLEGEIDDLWRRSKQRGSAVGEKIITTRNVAHTIIEATIQTDETAIPHGLGNIPVEYNVVITSPVDVPVMGSYVVSKKDNLALNDGLETITHGLGVIPDIINILPYSNTFNQNTVAPYAGCMFNYPANVTTTTAQFVINTTGGQWRGSIWFIGGGSAGSGTVPIWFETRLPDSHNLYLKSTASIDVRIFVRE
jgi:hypothetical protein